MAVRIARDFIVFQIFKCGDDDNPRRGRTDDSGQTMLRLPGSANRVAFERAVGRKLTGTYGRVVADYRCVASALLNCGRVFR